MAIDSHHSPFFLFLHCFSIFCLDTWLLISIPSKVITKILIKHYRERQLFIDTLFQLKSSKRERRKRSTIAPFSSSCEQSDAESNMKKIAIYGKGGIGKSTVCSNLSAAFSIKGRRVMQIGCDPKADSTLHLTAGAPPVPVISYLRDHGVCTDLASVVKVGFNGIVCVESGGPPPGIGCAGRGILSAFSVLEDLEAFERYHPDIVMFDVLGDVVCGGFTMPLREGWADEVYIVTSGEKMSLFAARSISAAVDSLSDRGYAKLNGIIGNCRGLPGEQSILEQFAKEAGTELLGIIPRDEELAHWESFDKTVVEGNPNAPVSQQFHLLAEAIIKKG